MKKIKFICLALVLSITVGLFGGCVVLKEKGMTVASKEGSDFVIMYNRRASDGIKQEAFLIQDYARNLYGVEMKDDISTSRRVYDNEIIVGAQRGEEYKPLYDSLKDGEYVVKAFHYEDTGRNRIVFAHKGIPALIRAMTRFCEIFNENEAVIPYDYEIRGKCSSLDSVMFRNENINLRDPNVLVKDGTYYMYGTGWRGYKNTSGNLNGEWTELPNLVTVPEDVDGCQWAPEVHEYKGAYYMFTTYLSKKTGHRGTTILKADSPEGPFVEISNGLITPSDWDAIDGTLYVDKAGQPWLVFVHEWTSTGGRGGQMAIAKMSDDLSKLISEPVEIFSAGDPDWATSGVTDGCYLYEAQNGQLLMIWSNFDSGYCVGIARSVSGNIKGPWTHDYHRIFSCVMTENYDGGHGTLFYDLDGNLMMSVHSPNSKGEGYFEAPTFVKLKELNGTLVWDIKDDIN